MRKTKGVYKKDLKGLRFGRVTVLEFSHMGGVDDHVSFWKCLCDCGKEFSTRGVHLSNGTTTSCGCYVREVNSKRGKDTFKNNLRGYIEAKRKPAGESSRNHLFYLYKYKAEKKGLEFSLSLEEFSRLTKMNCRYCGAEPSQVKLQKGVNPYIYNGLDRIDSSKGYALGNVAPCCGHCNVAKLDKSEDEFAEWIVRAYYHFAASKKFWNGVYLEFQGNGTAEWWHKELEENDISK